MTVIETVSFWLIYGIVVTAISGAYIHRLGQRLEEECRKAERYRKRLENLKNTRSEKL